jgi:hypothetical protein
MMLRRIFVAALLLFPVAACAQDLSRLTVQEVAQKLHQKNVYIYDNNAQERFQKSHVPGAKWLNPYDVKPRDFPADKSATLIFYCASEH